MFVFLVLSSIHGFRIVPHVGYMGTVHPKGMPFNDGRIGKIVGLGINDVHAKNFHNTDFVIVCLQSDNELPMSEMQKIGGSLTSFSK